MNDLVELVTHPHSIIILYVTFWVMSSAVSSLPAPHDKSGAFYTWAYKTLNTMCASLKQANLKTVLTPQVIQTPTEIEQK